MAGKREKPEEIVSKLRNRLAQRVTNGHIAYRQIILRREVSLGELYVIHRAPPSERYCYGSDRALALFSLA